MQNKTLFVALAAFQLFGCSHVQLGRDFDDNGDEIEQSESSARESAVDERVAPVPVIDKFDDDYYGEDDQPFLTAYSGKLGKVSFSVSEGFPAPYSDSRQQRVPDVWSSWGKPKELQVETVESKAAKNRVLALFNTAAGEGEALEQSLLASLRAALIEEFADEGETGELQTLELRLVSWGLSDRIGLYSANFRAELQVAVSLVDSNAETIWQGDLLIDAGEPDRPMAAISEFESEPDLLRQHFAIAGQFMAHKVLTTITGKRYSQPSAYDSSRWLDED